MPIIRKVSKGTSYTVALPIGWVQYYEKKTGKKLEKVEMKINGNLTIKPYIEPENKNENPKGDN